MSDAAPTALCVRCGERPAGLPRAPFGGALGQEIARRVCSACWAEWQGAEVMVINELKLNFMEPSAQEILAAHMKQFFHLDAAAR